MRGKMQWQTEKPLVPDLLSVKDALYFVWSLPVSVLITGAENKTLLQEKVELARHFSHMNDRDRSSLVDAVLARAGNDVEYYKKV